MKSQDETRDGTDDRRKANEGFLLFVIFGTLIAGLIGLMFFIDYYADSHAEGPRQIRDAADN
jgi:hypothetical protein